jgi:hypothetical protein
MISRIIHSTRQFGTVFSRMDMCRRSQLSWSTTFWCHHLKIPYSKHDNSLEKKHVTCEEAGCLAKPVQKPLKSPF